MKINFEDKEYDINEDDLIITSDINNNLMKKYLEYEKIIKEMEKTS